MIISKHRLAGSKLNTLPERGDLLTGAIMACATLLFISTASRTTGPALDALFRAGGGADRVAVIALVLNVALIIIAWSRHREAKRAMLEQAAAEQRAQLLRSRDAETDLLNRNCLRERTTLLIEQARESRGDVALLVINLNGFKKINDSYGDVIGDGLLRIISAVIGANVPKDALCARLGSAEFAVAVPFHDADEDKIMRLAEDLFAQLNLPVEIMGVSLNVSVSIGLSHLGFDCTDFTSLLRRGDVAMNAAKEKQNNRPLWFDGRMERSLRARNEIEEGLRRGIPLGEFVPYYQPIIEFSTGRVRGFEMLARWHHPAGGVIEPNVFIPVAEESGSIAALSETLMRAAFLDAKQWDPGLKLSVNIAPSQLTDPWLPQKILKILVETGFPAQRLEIEITESSLVENLEVAQGVVASIKSQGISLALDDFGTGYSSLAHLQAMPFDRIKIDRSFILSLTRDAQSQTIVKSIIALAKALNIPVTLEGVESAAIELRVRDLGSELGQGWFYGHAAPAGKTRLLLEENGLYVGGGSSQEDSDAWPAAPKRSATSY